MKDPIKIIHKFKNNNKRIQYKNYIFLGSLLPEEIIKILEIIKKKDFYNSLILISNKQYNLLKNYYGERWYENFFISYHLKSQFKIIENTPGKKRDLENKYGKDWYKEHINKEKLVRITYSFEKNYYDNLNDIKKRNLLKKKETRIDFRSHSYSSKRNYDIDTPNMHYGGSDENNEEENEAGEEDEEEEVDVEDIENIIEDDFDLEELAKLYEEENVETTKMIKETSKLISDAINDKKWEQKTEESIIDYDSSLDNLTYDSKLEDIFIKYYIYDEYIFKDDTIKIMRQKISTNIPLSDSFIKGVKLLPDNQYFWSEYNSENGKEEIMIGQKWIRKNELLKIDIKPNENLKIYEKLKNNLYYLKDSFGYKIKREDDETNIVSFYKDYMTMNEIYMIDIYNELGINYNPTNEEKKNIFDVYVKIYFPFITNERFENIIKLLKGVNYEKELFHIENIYNSIKNDVKLEKEIYTIIENTKNNYTNTSFDKYFNENYIIQSNIHVNINNPKNITGTTLDTKYNLYRIFDNFVVTNEYPFIQYQTLDGQITYKFYTKTENLDNGEVLSKWFENSPYGISFKILVENSKYIAINFQESGRIEYKITWKEENKSTINDIIKTYDYIRELLKKINSENKKIKIIMPEDEKFKYAFINTIQKFTIPENFKINHNDLSDFSRLFFPYISLVIEPKKRTSKKIEKPIEEKVSKYGTYLRYKRISKYDNLSKIHLRIIYFLRNYEITDKQLTDEISKQFNVTEEFVLKEIDFVKNKYNNVIKKSSKILKKLKNLPKSKPPGIGLDIQGRDRDNYKIRITGARNKEQLDDIVNFMKILIFLYCETYLYKKPKYQKLKDTLKLLTKIATRRNKVIEIVNYETTTNNVKIITAIDKKRLGFKPEKGQNQWTRSCQNSGNDKKRRPDIISSNNIEKLIKLGYKLNQKTGFYERMVELTVKKKKQIVTLRAIKLPGENNSFNFYTCDPSENKEHFYIGFLSRGNNPDDLCMPCCFKKDQLTATNKDKKKYYLKCIGEKTNEAKEENITTNNLGDKLYILQETNKVQDGRFIYLPKYLDMFFNQVWNNDHKIKNHYLYESKSGYFFKYTVKNENYNFLGAISNIFEKEIKLIIDIVVKFLEDDKDDIYFTYLNNGDLREIFKNKKNFIEYIKTSTYLEYDILGELLAIPGILSKNGIYFFILEKNNLIIKKILEKDTVIERYYLNCLNYENNYIINENRDFIILIKDGKYYHPIYQIKKDEKKDKKIILNKIFDENTKQVIELKNYNNQSCNKSIINKIVGNYLLFGKNIINNLNGKIKIKKQYIDTRSKAKYLLLENNLLLPVFPSGITYKIDYDIISNIKSLLSYDDTIKELSKINKILDMEYIPKIVFYDKKEKDKFRIVSIFLQNELIIPIKAQNITESELKKYGIPSRFQPLTETIDESIEAYNKNPIKIIDDRFIRVKQHLFKNESYNIFRLELSLFLENNNDIKENIINIVKSSKININDKKNEIRKILFKLKNFTELDKNLPNLESYNINNLREYCEINKTKDKCDTKIHCKWSKNLCKMRLTDHLMIDFINRVLEEIIQDNIQFKELIQENNYYVSDIVDYTQYTYRSNQKIIKTSNFNLNKIMEELFGKNQIPTIGRRQINKKSNDEIIEEYPELVELGKQLYQMIVPNKDSIIRAFINSYYWINNPLYDIESRNLGYFSDIQTLLTNRFKAKIIDYIQNAKNDNLSKYHKYLEKYFGNDKSFFDSSLNKFRKQSYNTNCKLELLILSLLTDYRIVVYDNYYKVIYLFLQGEVKVTDDNIKTFTKEEFKNTTIHIKLEFDSNNIIPKNIYSIYYK